MRPRHILLAERPDAIPLDVAGTLTKPFDPMTPPDQIAAILDRAEETP